MANSTIQASVRYLSDGASCAWPIPFPFGSPADLGVSVAGGGKERVLKFGKGYLVQNGCVIALVPAGETISIWLKTSEEAAIAGARQKAAAAMTAPVAAYAATAPAYEAPGEVALYANDAGGGDEATLEETVGDGLERLRSLANELTASMTQTLNLETARLRSELVAALETARASALSGLATAASDKANEVRAQGAASANNVHALERDAVSALDAAGRSYLEGMAQEAAKASARLAEARAVAASVEAGAQALKGTTGEAARLVKAAGKDAAISKDAARNAWAAAWQASAMANRPGVGAIGKMSELEKCGSGMFVINGRIVHTPTMFFGLWPVCCPCCAGWDGFFVIAPQFPDDPKLPPYPADGGDGEGNGAQNPGNPASVNGGAFWGPCIHHQGLFEDQNENESGGEAGEDE